MLSSSKLSQFHFKQIAVGLLLPALLIAIAFIDIPIRQTFEFDNDEGINLMKAFLYWKGFPLYTEIWSDQPPLLTAILSFWFNLVGPSVFASRLLILLFSALLIWSFYQVLKHFVGKIPAFIGGCLLIFSWLFLKISVSVMIGLPSLSLAMLSIYILTLYQKNLSRKLLIISGCLFALSLQIKLFTIFLIPLIILLLLNVQFARDVSKPRSQAWFHALLWFLSLTILYFLLGIVFHSFNYEQLIQTHLAESIKTEYDETNGLVYLTSMVMEDLDIGLLAIAGALVVWLRRDWRGIFPLAWFCTATLLLLTHRPIWYHHYPLISIPMVWLASYAVSFVVDWFQQNDWRSHLRPINFKKLFLPGLIILLLGFSVVMLPVKLSTHLGRPASQWEIVDILKKYREHTNWVVSDRPIIPFYAQLPVPPELAVFSDKRAAAGQFTYDDLLKILETYRPEQIVLARRTQEIKSNIKIKRFLKSNYSRTYAKVYSKSNPDAIAEHYLIKTYPKP